MKLLTIEFCEQCPFAEFPNCSKTGERIEKYSLGTQCPLVDLGELSSPEEQKTIRDKHFQNN